MGAPNKQPTSPQRRVVVRQDTFRQTGGVSTTIVVGNRSPKEQRLLERVEDLERELLQRTAKFVITEEEPTGEQVHLSSSVADDDDDDEVRNKVVATETDHQTGDKVFSDQDLEGMPPLLPRPATLTDDPTRVRRLVIIKKKHPPLTPSLHPSNSGRKKTRKVVKKKRRVRAGTLDEFLDTLEKESLLKGASSSAPTTSEEEDFVMTLRRAEYWKGQHLRADTRVKHLQRQKEQLQRRLEHLESGVIERLEHIVSTTGP